MPRLSGVSRRAPFVAVASVTGRGSPTLLSDCSAAAWGSGGGPERSGEGAKAMAGALRKTMLYLGLADDRAEHEDYLEDYDDGEVAVPTEYEAQVTPLHRPTRSAVPTQASPSVQSSAPGGELRRITTIHPRSYNDARKIGEAFREGTPVIMNLTDMDDADAKRLVDFSAGLIFGLHGAIE